MAFSDFTLKQVVERFDLRVEEVIRLFDEAPVMEPSPRLAENLEIYFPLATDIGTEKARSEFLIAPILSEVWSRMGRRISLFSGVNFPADPDRGLNGICDFILSRSETQLYVKSPLVVIVEAKNEKIKAGLGHCVAVMLGARFFNEREGSPVPSLYGAVTSGTTWQFLRLTDQTVSVDSYEYSYPELPKILGILTWMLTRDDEPGRLVA